MIAATLLFVAQTANAQIASAPASVCPVRLSVLQSYPPFEVVLDSGRRLNAQTKADGSARDALIDFDAGLAAALANVPASEEAAFALTDAERLIEAIERCADGLGVPRQRVRQSAARLEDGYLRNQKAMLQPEFAERLLRAPHAQQVLRNADHVDAIAAAETVKAANDQARTTQRIAVAKRAAERIQAADAEAAARAQAAAVVTRQIEDKVRSAEAVWRSNPSAPGSGERACDNDLTTRYAALPRDAAWMKLIEQEIGQCTRISSHREGSYFMGLALGTSVTDEQLAHAVGRTLICLSDSDSKRALDGMNRVTDALLARMGVGATGARAVPVWSERTSGTRRFVRVECQITMSVLGYNMQGMQNAMSGMMKADANSYVEYELFGDRLQGIKTHYVLSNQVSQQTNGFTNSTEYVCDDALSQADSVARTYISSGWKPVTKVPYRYTMQNDALVAVFAGPQSVRAGRWYTLQRGDVMIDLFNTRYQAPVYGKNGGCFGGAVDEFAMLVASHKERVKTGVSVRW